MDLHLAWPEIALRLLLGFVAGALVGFNREERASAAGLRTTILVCLAATVAMLEANVLLQTAAQNAQINSILRMDVMRLPLGVLSGMGFIGAGAIIRRGRLVRGITTAATLWFVTIIGFCLGGGQYGLGTASLSLALLTLWALKLIERSMVMHHQAVIRVGIDGQDPPQEEIEDKLRSNGLTILSSSTSILDHGRRRNLTWQVEWRSRLGPKPMPSSLVELGQHPKVSDIDWMPEDMEKSPSDSPW